MEFAPLNVSEVLVAGIVGATSVTTLMLKSWLDKRKHRTPSIDRSTTYMELDRIATRIRKDTSADGVYIASFHNGGVFHTKQPMDKYTVVGEDYGNGIKSYKSRYSAVLVNNISYMYHRLITDGRYAIIVSTNSVYDKSYMDDLNERNVSRVYSFSIKDQNSNKPIGFISLEYGLINSATLSSESHVWKHQADIARLLNGKPLK